MTRTQRMIAGLLVGAVVALAGCNRTLFTESDPYNSTRIDRYWDGDSAVKASESRQKATEMGFGFPTGMANQ